MTMMLMTFIFRVEVVIMTIMSLTMVIFTMMMKMMIIIILLTRVPRRWIYVLMMMITKQCC